MSKMLLKWLYRDHPELKNKPQPLPTSTATDEKEVEYQKILKRKNELEHLIKRYDAALNELPRFILIDFLNIFYTK